MPNTVCILTTAEYGSKFPESFSAWCAGALAAKGCDAAIVRLEQITKLLSDESLHHKKEQLVATFSVAKKLVLIFPEYNDMLPAGVAHIKPLFTPSNEYTTCKLVTLTIDPTINKSIDTQQALYLNYPLNKLDAFFGSKLSADRTQLKDSVDGDMCYLFKEFYSDLNALIKQILV